MSWPMISKRMSDGSWISNNDFFLLRMCAENMGSTLHVSMKEVQFSNKKN